MPFYILHVDILSPGKLVDTNKDTIQMVKLMCDLTQFVISSFIWNINVEILEKIFMEEVALLFGMTSVIVVDVDRKFRSVFDNMCKALKVHFFPLSRGNHKGLSVDKYHQFLKKKIVSQDRGTHLSILKNVKTSQYACNSATI